MELRMITVENIRKITQWEWITHDYVIATTVASSKYEITYTRILVLTIIVLNDLYIQPIAYYS